MSVLFEIEEVSNSRNVFSPQQRSTATAVEIEEMELLIGRLSADEEAFFEAVQSGDKESVQTLLHDKQVDVNRKNTKGETALQIAVDEEAIDIIKTLLENRAEIGSTLFQAVRNNSLQCVRILVAYDSNRRISTAKQRNPATTSKTVNCSAGKFDEFLTPLGLAVLKGNYAIVEFLVSKGYIVEDAQSQKAQDAAEGSEKESMYRLKDSLVKLNTYRALASPLYISHLFLHQIKHQSLRNAEHAASDPLFRSLVLKKKLKELAVSEYEFRDDYTELSTQCENFAIQLLDECRNLEEIAAVMDMPELEKMEDEVHLIGKEKRFRVLNLAIKHHNIKFIAHPYSQVMLNSVVYKGTSGWRQLSFPTKLALVMLYTIVMPLCMVGYMLTPANRLTKKLETPLFKLMSQASSVLWFLVLVAMSAFEDEYESLLQLSPLTITIAIWVLGITVQEIKHALQQKGQYFLAWWHLAVVPMIVCYITAGVLWTVGYAFIASDSGSWTVDVRQLMGSTSLAPYHLLLLSNSFYSFAVVLTFFEASHILLANSTLGPLHLSLMNMGRDIMKFFALCGLNVCAFTLAFRKLYSQYMQTSTQVTENNSSTTSYAFERIEGAFGTLFWALFGHVEMSNFKTNDKAQITEVTGYLLFAIYSLVSVLVAVNLLIAMLSNTYKKVDDEKDIKFKFARTLVWMYYVSEISALPPPFNLFPIDKANWFRKCFGCFEKEQNTTRVKTNENRRQVVIKSLIERYFFATKKSHDDEPDEEESLPPKEIQHKLMELTKALQRLQNVVKRSHHRTAPEKRNKQETQLRNEAVLSMEQEL